MLRLRLGSVSVVLAVAALLATACAGGPAAKAPPSSAVVPRGAIATPADPIEVAITVDDLPRHGPDVPGVTRLSIHEKMLAVFAAHKTPPVYGFVNAKKLEGHAEDREALAAWVRAGHPLGNHTFSHPDLGGGMSVAEYLADVDANEAALRDLTPPGDAAERTWKVFRYPFLREGRDLETRKAIREALLARHYRLAEVTIDFYDWAYNPPYARCLAKGDTKTIDALEEDYLDHAAFELRWADEAARELFGRPMKQILLLHVGAFDAEMMDALLTTYEKNGAKWVSLDAALADPIYAAEPAQPKAHFGNFLSQVRKARGTRSPAMAPPPDTLLELVCR